MVLLIRLVPEAPATIDVDADTDADMPTDIPTIIGVAKTDDMLATPSTSAKMADQK